jgi:Arc/MetJ-type ribon-helix-helix transcriptional regulator
MVPVEMKTRTMNISLPERLVEALDRRAEAEARSRSEVIRAAALSYLQWWEDWRRLQAYGRRQAKRLGIRPQRLERLIAQVRTERSPRR